MYHEIYCLLINFSFTEKNRTIQIYIQQCEPLKNTHTIKGLIHTVWLTTNKFHKIQKYVMLYQDVSATFAEGSVHWILITCQQ